MALAERTLSNNTASTDGATTISVTPTGQQEGDWVQVGVISAGGTGAHSNTAGGLSRATAADIALGTVAVASTWKKKCGAGESGTTYTFSFGGSTRRAAVIVVCYSGGDGTDIVESAPAGDSSGAGASSLAVTGVDPAATGGVHLVWEFSRTAGGVAQDFDSITDYPELTAEVSSAHATNANANMVVSARALPNADATGSITFSVQTADRLGGASVLLKPSSNVTGDIDVTLPALTAALDGAVTVDGDAAVTLPALAVEVDGTVTVDGPIAAALPALTVEVDGAVTVDGPIAVTLPALTAALDGAVTVDGPIAVTLPALTAALDGTVAGGAVSGALVATLPALTADADGTVRVDGVVVVALPALTVDADGTVRVDGAIGVTLPALTVDASGSLPAKATSVATVTASATSSPTVTASRASVATVTALAASSPTVEG